MSDAPLVRGSAALGRVNRALFAAVVIGGVSLNGGVGSLSGVYAGVLLLSAIQTAINLMGMPAHYTQMILGGMVLAAVLLDTVKLAIRKKLA